MADSPFVSLYRRFRPGRFSELRGQDHVVRALQSAVRDERVSHAYLFSGPRGTGKTSSARILAKALNCLNPEDGEPCGSCPSCVDITRGTSLDVHELDAASNNGVEAMRDLVAHAALGTPGRWKVYIVDEVHMLSTAAANALLKTLEEPPSHVVFVLATTDPQKVPPTIRSRTQHLEFRLLPADTLRELLTTVVSDAGLDVSVDSVQAAVRRGRGSARDALSALDQVAASGTADSARPELDEVVTALAESDVTGLLVHVTALLAAGWGPQQLATELVDDLRQAFLAALAPDLCATSGAERDRFTKVAETMTLARVVRSMEIMGQGMVDMRDAPDAQIVLEISLVRAAKPELDGGAEALAERVSSLERAIAGMARPSAAPAVVVQAVVPAEGTGQEQPATAAPADAVARRPSVGAVRRKRDADATPAPGALEVPVEVPAPPAAVAPENQNGVTRVIATEARAVPLDRDALTQAWGDGILQRLPAFAKALFSAGRFVSVGPDGVEFALPNQAHRDRCTELTPQVESALSSHFGTPVHLLLVIDDGQGGTSPSPAHTPGDDAPEAGAVADVEHEEDLSLLRGDEPAGADQASAAEARLREAFPGSEVVE